MSDVAERHYVTFFLGKERFGIEVMRVREVLYLTEITRVPDTEAFMRGVLDLRGVITPLVDARLRFHLDERAYDRDTVIIIIEYGERLIGLIVDAVSDVLGLELDALQDAEHFAGDVERDYVRGIARAGDGLVIILDVDRIFISNELERMNENGVQALS